MTVHYPDYVPVECDECSKQIDVATVPLAWGGITVSAEEIENAGWEVGREYHVCPECLAEMPDERQWGVRGD